MEHRRKVVAICGSTREKSSNLSLIKAIRNQFEHVLDMDIFTGLVNIPQFNPDLDGLEVPGEVQNFRNKLRSADGILICTPEYAMGVPGSLKNALDWTVSSMEFSHKPVALITASSQGEKGHASLLETLKVIESEIPETSQLLISYIKTKVKEDEIVDEETRHLVKGVLTSFLKVMGVGQGHIL